MELARRRFLEAAMGTEMHAGTPQELQEHLRFRPTKDLPVMVHLPRSFDLVEESSQARIREFALSCAGQVRGLVIHDHASLATSPARYVEAAWQLEDQFEKILGAPLLFIEYAAGIAPGQFAAFFESIRDLERLSACVDIGHVGIRAARAAYAQKHPGEDVVALKSQGPRLPEVIGDVESAVEEGAATVRDLLETLAALKKPLHFHLHDGHPLSTFSSFGVSDHLSFLSEIPLSFEYRGRRSLPPMYGPDRFAKLVQRALSLLSPGLVSLTLEIHPTGERLPLDAAADRLFRHWSDKASPERMNHWLSVLAENHRLLLQAVQPAA